MDNKVQLFCFTHAGGNADFFDVIEPDLMGISMVKVEHAGHGKRHKEPCCCDFNELSEDVFRILKSGYIGEKYALFGYSMGTITLVEVLRKIMGDTKMPLPECVFLAAHEPRTMEFVGLPKQEIDAWVKDRTIRFGAVPEKLHNNKSFWRVYLPLYCADYSMIGKYRFEDLELNSQIPAYVFYSETDTPFAEMVKWKQYFVEVCEFFEYEGEHFFIQQHHREIASVIHAKIHSGGNVS